MPVSVNYSTLTEFCPAHQPTPAHTSSLTDLVAPLGVDDDGLSGHGVLVVVLVVLVEDGGDFLAVLPDAEQGLLVVVGGDVEHEEVLPTNGHSEDARVGVEAGPGVAMHAVEGEVLLAAAVVGLVPGVRQELGRSNERTM